MSGASSLLPICLVDEDLRRLCALLFSKLHIGALFEAVIRPPPPHSALSFCFCFSSSSAHFLETEWRTWRAATNLRCPSYQIYRTQTNNGYP